LAKHAIPQFKDRFKKHGVAIEIPPEVLQAQNSRAVASTAKKRAHEEAEASSKRFRPRLSNQHLPVGTALNAQSLPTCLTVIIADIKLRGSGTRVEITWPHEVEDDESEANLLDDAVLSTHKAELYLDDVEMSVPRGSEGSLKRVFHVCFYCF
jgi:hypothetical protein